MKYYRKRNIHHPIIIVGGQPVPWIRIGSGGVLATEDAETIKVLDEGVEKSRGQITALEQKDYDAVIEGEKKTQLPSVRRTFPARLPTTDKSRSEPSPAQPEPQSSDSQPQGVAPAKSGAKRGRPARVAVAAPIVEPPPGVTGIIDEPVPEP